MLAAVAAIFMAGMAEGVAAESDGDPVRRIELSGFGTLGVARTDTDSAEFIRDHTQPRGVSSTFNIKTDSTFGIQGNFRATDSLEFGAQAVSRYAAYGNFRPEITWAFAKYSLTPGLVLRGGRLGTEFYMQGDSRNIGYSWLTVRPPVDFFGLLAFNAINGLDLTSETSLGDGILKAKVFAGTAVEKAPFGAAMINLNGSPVFGTYLDYQQGNWQWRATYAQFKFNHDIPENNDLTQVRDLLLTTGVASAAAAARTLTVKGSTSRFYSIGASFDRGPVQAQAMVREIRHESLMYENSSAAYVTAGYRLGEITPFVSVSRTRSKPRGITTGLPVIPGNPFKFDELNAGFADAAGYVHIDQRTSSLGARWDFRRDLALKAQIDSIRRDPTSRFLLRGNGGVAPVFNGDIKVFSLALDFVF